MQRHPKGGVVFVFCRSPACTPSGITALFDGDYGVTVNTGACGALNSGSIPDNRPWRYINPASCGVYVLSLCEMSESKPTRAPLVQARVAGSGGESQMRFGGGGFPIITLKLSSGSRLLDANEALFPLQYRISILVYVFKFKNGHGADIAFMAHAASASGECVLVAHLCERRRVAL